MLSENIQRKPLLFYEEKKIEKTFQIRRPKYVAKLSSEKNPKDILSIKNVKKLTFLNLEGYLPKKFASKSLILHVLKFYRKSIKKTDGIKPILFKYLPNLAKYDIKNSISLKEYRVFRNLQEVTLLIVLKEDPYRIGINHNVDDFLKALNTPFFTVMKRLGHKGFKFTILFTESVILRSLSVIQKLYQTSFFETNREFEIVYSSYYDSSDDEDYFTNGYFFPFELLEKATQLRMKITCEKNLRLGISGFKNLKLFEFVLLDNLPEDFKKLAVIQNFNNLRRFSLKFRPRNQQEMNTFLDNFCPPSSVESLNLDFTDILWEFVLQPKDKSALSKTEICDDKNNLFLELAPYQKFYEKWKSLTHLKNLSLNFSSNSVGHGNTGYFFVIPILKELNVLESLSIITSNNAFTLSKIHTKLNPLLFNYLWEGIESSKSTLKSLVILSDKINFASFPQAKTQFTNLDLIRLEGCIDGVANIHNLLESFPKKPESRLSLSLRIRYIYIDNDSYKSLFDQLLYIPENWNVLILLRPSSQQKPDQKVQGDLLKFLKKAKIEGILRLNMREIRHSLFWKPVIQSVVDSMSNFPSVTGQLLIVTEAGNIKVSKGLLQK